MAGLNSYALVAYLAGPLAQFVNNLRCGFTPGCTHRAHVTLLPPRPLACTEQEAIAFSSAVAVRSVPFEITAGDVGLFESSRVIKLSVDTGVPELRRLHGELNAGPLRHDEKFDYEPHITLAQHLPAERLDDCFEQARSGWKRFGSDAVFLVDTLTFVQEMEGDEWRDRAALPLGMSGAASVTNGNGARTSAALPRRDRDAVKVRT